MKKITIYIMLILAGSVFSSCDKEDEPKTEFSIDSIKKTFWKGTLRVNLKDGSSEEGISLLFIDDKTGQFETEKSVIGSFSFMVEGKVLIISGLKALNLGDIWVVTEYSKNKLILQNGFYPEQTYKTLDLTRND